MIHQVDVSMSLRIEALQHECHTLVDGNYHSDGRYLSRQETPIISKMAPSEAGTDHCSSYRVAPQLTQQQTLEEFPGV